MSKKRKMKVDLTGVEAFVRAEEGQHTARVVSADEKVSASTGSDMIEMKYEVVKGESAGAVVYDNIPLSEKALWRLKQLLSVLGMKNEGKVIVDLDAMIGKTLIIEVRHEEYNGVTRAKVSDIKKLSAADVDNEDDEDYDFDDEEDEEEEKPKKSSKSSKSDKKSDKKSKSKKDEDEDDEDEEYDDYDEDEDEEEEKPKSKKQDKKPAKKEEKSSKSKSKSKKQEEEDEDDEDDWEDD